MSYPESPSRDSRAVDTVNGGRYANSNAAVYVNPQGLPVAFRRVRVLRPGTFAGASRLQVVTPQGVTDVERSRFESWRRQCHPLN